MTAEPTSGDGFFPCACGGRHWGRFGAAGLLVLRDGAVLLQHRAMFLQEGGTWALPGGALDEGETALEAALRESQEEADIAPTSVVPRHAWAVDHGEWRYTTIVADAVADIDARSLDGEGLAVEWVQVDQVEQMPLHSGFAASWPYLRALLAHRDAVVAQAGAMDADRLARLQSAGLPGGSPLVAASPGRTHAWPTWEVSSEPSRRARQLSTRGWHVSVITSESALAQT